MDPLYFARRSRRTRLEKSSRYRSTSAYTLIRAIVGRVRHLQWSPVEAAITLAALPVASVVLWTLLRSPSLGGRLVAVPTGARWHDRTTPLFGGVGIAAGLLAGVLLALATGALDGFRDCEEPRAVSFTRTSRR